MDTNPGRQHRPDFQTVQIRAGVDGPDPSTAAPPAQISPPIKCAEMNHHRLNTNEKQRGIEGPYSTQVVTTCAFSSTSPVMGERCAADHPVQSLDAEFSYRRHQRQQNQISKAVSVPACLWGDLQTTDTGKRTPPCMTNQHRQLARHFLIIAQIGLSNSSSIQRLPSGQMPPPNKSSFLRSTALKWGCMPSAICCQ